ncbi:hypothetical protein K439DRAFT_1613457 [Ramaria rubella]|nr:hypothetical protein K439DRAFT_1613457 [Ramaria rubella]
MHGSAMQVDDDSSDSSSSDNDDDDDSDSDMDSSSSSNNDPDQDRGDSLHRMDVDSVMAVMNISTQQNSVNEPIDDSIDSEETDPMDKLYVPPPERLLAPGVPLPPSSVATDEQASKPARTPGHHQTQNFICEKYKPYECPPSQSTPSIHTSKSTLSTHISMYSKTEHLREDMVAQKANFEAKLAEGQAQLQEEKSKCCCEHHKRQMAEICTESAEAHCTIQRKHTESLRAELDKKKRSCKVNIHVCVLTCKEAEEEWRQQVAEEDAKKAEKAAKAKAKAKAKEKDQCTRTTTWIHDAIMKMFDALLHTYC